MEKATRKPRATKLMIHSFVKWYLANEEHLSTCTYQRIQQIYLEEMKVNLSPLTIKNNIHRFALVNNKLIPVEFLRCYEK